MHKITALLFFSLTLFADYQPPYTFNTPQPECTLIDKKLVLGRKWPLGNWESCAYAVLSVAQQLDALRDKAERELQAQKQLVSELQKRLEEIPKKK